MENFNLEALVGKTQEQAKKEYIKGIVSGVKNKIILPILSSGLGKESIQKVLQEFSLNGYNLILTLPSYTAQIFKQNKNCPLGVAINYPLGENVCSVILKEISLWSKSLIKEICVVLPLTDIKFNKFKICEKILKKLLKVGKKKQVSIMVETSKLTDAELLDFSRRISNFKLDKIYTSACFVCDEYEEKTANLIRANKKNFDIKLVCCGKTDSASHLQKALSCYDFVLTDKATIFLEETLSKIDI